MQDALDVEAAKKAILPPLQSVLELTSAAAPPRRNEEPVLSEAATMSAGLTFRSILDIHVNTIDSWFHSCAFGFFVLFIFLLSL